MAIMETSNDESIARAIQGDAEAFSDLYERYVTRIFNYIYYRVGNSNDAEDLTARVFLRAYSHIEKYNERGLPFSAWLYRIAHNLVANWYRDNSRRKDISLDGPLQLIDQRTKLPEHELILLEEREKMLGIIRKLPIDRQELLILKFVDGLSNIEIGEVLGRTEGAVKSLYHRTLLSIRDDLDKFINLSDLDTD
jgi:RNA polymerase sigma-70 factor, ECF subfamily